MISKSICGLAILLLVLCSAGTSTLIASGGNQVASAMSGITGAAGETMEKLNINPQAFAGGIKLLPLQDFNDWAKYYQKDTIYADDYKWLENDIPTYSIKTLLIVNEAKLSDQDRKDLALIIEGINTNMDKLKTNGHQKWKEVDLTDWDSNDWPLFK